MALIKAIWGVMNGKKFNTGAVIALIGLVLTQYLKFDAGSAQAMAVEIVTCGGTLIAIIGAIHKAIKDKAAKK